MNYRVMILLFSLCAFAAWQLPAGTEHAKKDSTLASCDKCKKKRPKLV